MPDNDDRVSSDPGSKQDRNRTRKPYVRVIRPLRDVGRKECALWAWWRGLDVVGKERWPWSGAKQDIGTLTRGTSRRLTLYMRPHVRGRVHQWPREGLPLHRLCDRPNMYESRTQGSVRWVMRSMRAVGCPYDYYNAFADRTRCSPVQEGIQEWKSRISIRSRDDSPPPPSVSPSLTPYLCYGCHTTLTSRSSRPAPPLELPPPDRSTVPLPLWVGSGMPRARMGEQQMKDVVSEFLLEDDT